MNKRYYEHTLPIIRGSLSNTYYSSSVNRTITQLDAVSVLVGLPPLPRLRGTLFFSISDILKRMAIKPSGYKISDPLPA